MFVFVWHCITCLKHIVKYIWLNHYTKQQKSIFWSLMTIEGRPHLIAILRDLLVSAPSIYILLNKFSIIYKSIEHQESTICCEHESYRSCSYDTICNYFSLSLHCGTEWEDMLCTIFHMQGTQHEYTEGLKCGDSKGHYINIWWNKVKTKILITSRSSIDW